MDDCWILSTSLKYKCVYINNCDNKVRHNISILTFSNFLISICIIPLCAAILVTLKRIKSQCSGFTMKQTLTCCYYR